MKVIVLSYLKSLCHMSSLIFKVWPVIVLEAKYFDKLPTHKMLKVNMFVFMDIHIDGLKVAMNWLKCDLVNGHFK